MKTKAFKSSRICTYAKPGGVSQPAAPQNVATAILVGAEGLEREVDQCLDVGVGVGVGEVLGSGGAVFADGLVFAAELGIEIAADEVEDGIGRIFILDRGGDFEGLRVFLVVVVKAE